MSADRGCRLSASSPPDHYLPVESARLSGEETGGACSQGLRTGTTRWHNGVGAGDIVAVLTSPNHPKLLSTRYAAHLLGAAVVHIRSMNPRTDAETFSFATQAGLLRGIGARILVVDEANAEHGRALAGEVTGLTVLNDDGGTGVASGDATVEEWAMAPRYSPDDLAVIDFTSGSTGGPKMVQQPFGTWEARIAMLSPSYAQEPPATLLSMTPVCHTTAPMADTVLSHGGTVVLHEGFHAGAVLDAVAVHEITDAYLAVPYLYRLLEHPGTAHANLSSLRRVIYSGTPAAPARITKAAEVFKDALIQVYGTTEAGGITSLSPLDHLEPELLGSVGRPVPWVRVELRDSRSDTLTPPGEVGEVCVISPTLMGGYRGQSDLTARVLREGWLRTGDLGRWDAYGYLHLMGRVGDVIKSGGLKLDPVLIERTLLAHPQVKNATVYGVRDEDYVEHVHAAVELRPSADCGVEDLRAHVASTLSSVHVPEDITVWDELPLLASGKPDHAFLRSRNG